jgi:MFS family permease
MEINDLAKRIQRTYLALLFGNTLAASLIWGVNTLFLLDAGLSNFEAFAANAFFTLGMVLFEVPTGVVADSWSRRASYLLGTLTLSATTLAYYFMWQFHAPFIGWAIASLGIGLGFSFFSGSVEAWLVDALAFAGFKGKLENVFGRGQVVSGVAMLSGSLGGGFLAQATSLGGPFIARSAILILLFVAAAIFMRDWGFVPEKHDSNLKAMRSILSSSVTYGLKNPPVRWMMVAAIFSASVGFYAFYALQPYLLQLYGNNAAYWVAGLAAAIVAGSQILGGALVGKIRELAEKRTTIIIGITALSCIVLVALGFIHNFYAALFVVSIWGMTFAAVSPVRQAYLNGMIPSRQRATVLSFDSLMGNTGGVAIQPALGKAADVYSYGTSLLFGGVLQVLALPFIVLSRKQNHPSDRSITDENVA